MTQAGLWWRGTSDDTDGDDLDGLQESNEETEAKCKHLLELAQLASRAAVEMFVVPCWHFEDPLVNVQDDGVQQGILRGAILKIVLKAFASFLQLYLSVLSLRRGISKFESQEESATFRLKEKPPKEVWN